MSPRRAGREGSLAFVVETPGPKPQPCSRQWGDLGLSQDAQKRFSHLGVRRTESLPYAIVERI